METNGDAENKDKAAKILNVLINIFKLF